jgi:putative ABC transport system permease protein
MNLTWTKLVRDVSTHRVQAIALLATLVIGTAGTLALRNTGAVLAREIPANFERAKPHDVVFWFENTDPRVSDIVRALPNVAGVQWRGAFNSRVLSADGLWRAMAVTVAEDPVRMEVDRVVAEVSRNPESTAKTTTFSDTLSNCRPGEGRDPSSVEQSENGGALKCTTEPSIFLERSGRPMVRASADHTLTVRNNTGADVQLPLSGFVFDPAVAPSTQEQTFYGYANLPAARAMNPSAKTDQLAVAFIAQGNERDTLEFADDVRAALKKANLPAPIRVDARRATHPHGPLMGAMLKVVEILGWLATLTAAALTAGIASAWLRRDMPQIAAMKTIGATTATLLWPYAIAALVLIAAGLVLALPLGLALSDYLIKVEAAVINIDLLGPRVSLRAVALGIALAVALVLAAILFPVMRACMRPVIAVLRGPGIVAPSFAARLLSRLPQMGLNASTRLALRNVWRRPWRALMIVTAFALGGALLLITRSNYISYVTAIDANIATRGHNLELLFATPQDRDKLVQVALAQPAVAHAEAWPRARVTPTGVDAEPFTVAGVPDGSRFFLPAVTGGRNLDPAVPGEIVVTRFLVDRHPALQPGSTFDLKFRDRTTRVKLVGIIDEIVTPAAYASAATYEAITGLGATASSVRIAMKPGDGTLAANDIDRAFVAAGLVPAQSISASVIRESLIEHFLVVGEAMRLIALGVALLGALALLGTTLFNTLDRIRELAILKAIGAPPASLVNMLLIESGSVIAVGGAVGVLLSLAISRALLNAGERLLVHIAVPMQFSWVGFGQLVLGGALTFVLVGVVVWRFARRPVVSGLAYE